MIYLKYLIFIAILYFSILFGTFLVVFEPLKNSILETQHKLNIQYIKNFEAKVKIALLNNRNADIHQDILNLKDTYILSNLTMKYIHYYITIDSILEHSNNIKTKDWILDDISMDVKFGELKKITDVIYEVIPDEDYNFEEPIEIKFQALNNINMQNSISTINLKLPQVDFDNYLTTNNTYIQQLKDYLHLDIQSKTTILFINKTDEYVQINYNINNKLVIKKLYTLLKDIFIIYTILFFLIIILTIIFNVFMVYNNIIVYLKKLEDYTLDVLNNKFYKFDSKLIKQKNIANITQSIGKISKKMASIVNELNVNKNILELQVSTDTLTKLPNTKIFEQDMKALFLTDIKSYVSMIKLEILKDFAKNNSQIRTDQLIVDFVNILKDVMLEFNNKHSQIYRFYGAQFIIISKFTSYDLMEKILIKIEERTLEIIHKYKFNTKIYHSVAIAFDHYSTTDKIVNILEHTFNSTKNNTKSYIIEDSKEIDAVDKQLETVVANIIKNDAFSISYKFNTYLFDEPDTLIMQEVAANLLHSDGTPIPIGTFISVAEHNNLATQFDKQMIIKVFKYIKKYNITHDLAVNISISSINDDNFMTWLESEILYTYKGLIDKIVFSVTTFAVTNNYDSFVKFSTEIRKFKGRVLLKRFSYNDLTLEQLEQLDLDFIRVHKDYTTNINDQRTIILKNIINFTTIHDIFVLGDLVNNKADYDILKGLKFYATSK